MKWQSLTLPGGMIRSVYGPVEGRRHDTTVLRFSGLVDFLQILMYLPGLCVCRYGGYPLAEYLLACFTGVARTPEQLERNQQMSTVKFKYPEVVFCSPSPFQVPVSFCTPGVRLQPIPKCHVSWKLISLQVDR